MCYCQPHHKEDMLCYFQPHCEEDIAVYFYKCVYQKEFLRCQVPSRDGLCEWDMLAIKIKERERERESMDEDRKQAKILKPLS